MIAGTPISGTTGNAAPVSQAPLCWICSYLGDGVMNGIKTPPFPTAADVRPQEAIREDLRRGRSYPVASVSTLCGRMWPISIITHLQAGLPELHARAHPPRS